MFPGEMLSLLFPLTLLLSLSVQQAVSSPADDSLEDQTVMDQRISKLLSLFNLLSPDTTTAVVFGSHSRYDPSVQSS